MPYPRKPHTLKVITGSRQPDAQVVELPLVAEIPEPPAWMQNELARAEWARLGKILKAAGLLTEANLTALAVLCSLTGKIAQLTMAGETPTANLVAQWRALTNDFGITPAAQGKVKPQGDGPKGNKFSKFK